MEIVLANPRGFCAGVDRAIAIVERALELFGSPIYVRHEVVHNRHVVENLRERGAVFVEELDEIPDGSTVIFSAHGVSRAVEEEAARRGLKVFDATCPLVTKVHMEVARHAKAGREVVLIGHQGHPEVEGTKGRYDNPNGSIYTVGSIAEVEALCVDSPDNLAYVTQTTLSVDDTAEIIAALQKRFPSILGPKNDDICYATQNRQDAVKALSSGCDLIIVVGSANSSNSNRLRELAEKHRVEAYLIDGPDALDASWIRNRQLVGVTAGASAPEEIVESVVEKLQSLGATLVPSPRKFSEDIHFPLPAELR
ncbi:MAG: 4-hydroxy-3-methylbut-2-enyl diphosphate reductase [Proteobacteria bacterium]|nr:MAG: 4-hydroxy-3-methylbut-2-enyl diphosphate reductase [Pseudomonadota bacterium]